MTSVTITTFSGLRCTKLPRTDIFTTTSAISQPTTTDSSNSILSTTSAASAASPTADPETGSSSNTAGNKSGTSTALPAHTASSSSAGVSGGSSLDPLAHLSDGSNQPNVRAAIGGSLGAVALIAVLFLIWYLLRRRRDRRARQAATFYAGEKLNRSGDNMSGVPTRPLAGGARKQALQVAITGLMASLSTTAQAIREGTSKLKSGFGSAIQGIQTKLAGLKAKSNSSMIRTGAFEQSSSDDRRDENQRGGDSSVSGTRVDIQTAPRLANPFADPLNSKDLPDNPPVQATDTTIEPPQNPFNDPKNLFDLDFDFNTIRPRPLGGEERHSSSESTADLESRYSSSDTSSTVISLPGHSSIGTNVASSPYQMSAADLDRWRRERGTVTRTMSMRSDPFDLERPPTVYTANTPGALVPTRGRSRSSRYSRYSRMPTSIEESSR